MDRRLEALKLGLGLGERLLCYGYAVGVMVKEDCHWAWLGGKTALKLRLGFRLRLRRGACSAD